LHNRGLYMHRYNKGASPELRHIDMVEL